MKRLIQRAAALTAALCLAAACMAPVYAETANTEKEENVYVSLAGDGSVADIYIVNMFALDGKTEIRDYGAYSSVRNLTSEADISLDGDSVTVSAEAGTFYYQGNLKDAQLPCNISVAYMLDGKNVAADELAGANGHLVISGSVTKNKLADGDFYETYMVQATVLLDTVKCRNIQTEGATEANVGADKQLSYMKLPGQDLSFTIETDVTDFSMEGISLNAVPLAIHMEKPDTSELDGQIDDLQDGAQQLDDGAKELAAGAQELNSGAAAVASGAASLVAGANTLSGGAAGLAGATSELSSGLSLLAGQSAALQSGAGTIFDSLLSAANTQLENLLTRTSLSYTPMTRENYAAVLADVQQQIGGAALKAATEEARAKVTAEVTAAVQVQVEQQATRAARAQAEAEVRKQEQPIRDGVTAAIREQVKASITEEQIFSAAYENVCTQPGAENMTEEEKRGAAAALAASEREALLKTVTDTAMVSPEVQQQIDTQVENEVQKQVDAVMAMPETQAAIQQQIDGQMVSDEVQGLIAMNIESAMAGDAVQSEIAAAVEQATGADSALIKPLNTLATQLTGFDAFYQGLLQYTNGVDSAARAASQVADGTARLQAGAAQVSGGAASLQQGSRSLTDGAARLAGGSSELAEGTGELRGRTSDMDGQLNDKIDDLIDGFTGADYEICSFVSEKNTQVDAVQFVMTTPAIEEAEARRAPAQEAQTLSLWQRLLALFQ